MIFGAILAGGSGTRMNIESMPKQFLPLGEKPIFIHTLEKFLLCSRFDAVYVGVHPDWVNHAKNVINKYISASTPIHVLPGGADRNSTIMNIVDGIERDYGIDETSWIVTHDSVRPFVKLSIIEQNIDAARTCQACDTVIPATDTIVQSANGRFIDDIPYRGAMYQGQTPQSFNIRMLKDVYSSLSKDEKDILTDACKMFVIKGYDVAIVPGDVTNIKLTTLMDYKVAQAMLNVDMD